MHLHATLSVNGKKQSELGKTWENPGKRKAAQRERHVCVFF